MSGIVFVWAAHATKILKPYEPISWVIAATIGAIVFCFILLLAMYARNIAVNATLRRRFYESGERINPIQSVFQSQRIHISDLAPPVGFRISDKTFLDCEIIGPANIILSGSGSLSDSGFTQSDMIILNNTNVLCFNATEFYNCSFLRCKFFLTTMLVPEVAVSKFEGGFKENVVWLSDPRIRKTQQTL